MATQRKRPQEHEFNCGVVALLLKSVWAEFMSLGFLSLRKEMWDQSHVHEKNSSISFSLVQEFYC
jgi:hypothetical protein